METSLLKADIFFFVATIAVVVITLLLIVGLVYLIIFLRHLKAIAIAIKQGTDIALEGAEELKTNIKRGTMSFSVLARIAHMFTKRRKSKK